MKGGYQLAFTAAGAAYSYVAPYYGRVNRTGGLQQFTDALPLALAGGSETVTINKRKTQQLLNGMQHFSQSRGRYGRRRRRTLFSRIKNLEEKVIDRWQGVSQFGVGGGYYRIAKQTDSGNTIMPFHVMDLSYQPNNTVGAGNFHGHRSFYINGVTGNLSDEVMPSQLEDGSRALSGTFVQERGQAIADVGSVFHRWTQIKLNLYGSLNRPIKYKVFLFKMDDDACFGYTPTGDSESHLAFESLIKPYIYSNLLGNVGEQKKHVRMLKQWNYVINPLNKIDAVTTEHVDSNHNPNFQEVKIFVRHNMNINYEWYDHPTTAQLKTDVPNVDTFHTEAAQVNAHASPSARLFFGIMATSGSAFAVAGEDDWRNVASDDFVQNYGSYDMVLRRCYTYSRV